MAILGLTHVCISVANVVAINDDLFTLESGINIGVCLLIFEIFSRGYVLIKGGYVH